MDVAEEQEHELYVPRQSERCIKWENPVNGEVVFLCITGDVQVVTRKSVSELLPVMTVQADGVSL